MTKDLAIVYSNRSLESDRAIALLKYMELPYIEYLVGVDFSMDEFRKEFGDEAEFPQVAVGVRHVGSLKDTLHYFEYTGKL